VRILHLDTEPTWRGGEQQVTYLVRGLLARGHDNVLVSPPGSAIARRFHDEGWTSEPLVMRNEADPIAVAGLVHILRRHRPDIVHMHTARAHTLGVAASLAARVGRRIVSRRVDFRPRGLSARLKYRMGVDRFLAITEAVAAVLRSAGVPNERIAVVPSGIDPARVRGGDGALIRAELGLTANDPVTGSVAFFAWHKGLDVLVRAWPLVVRDIPGAVLVLVGDGEDRALLEAEAKRGGVADRVRFMGFRHDVANCLAAFDVFVLPSLMEGMGTSLLDALAAERPVVATRVGGIPEVITDGETGLLVEPGSEAPLAAAVVRLLSDRRLAEQLAERGRARVVDRFSDTAMVEGTLTVYERVLSVHHAISR